MSIHVTVFSTTFSSAQVSVFNGTKLNMPVCSFLVTSALWLKDYSITASPWAQACVVFMISILDNLLSQDSQRSVSGRAAILGLAKYHIRLEVFGR